VESPMMVVRSPQAMKSTPRQSTWNIYFAASRSATRAPRRMPIIA
jgi:hypothetical protein